MTVGMLSTVAFAANEGDEAGTTEATEAGTTEAAKDVVALTGVKVYKTVKVEIAGTKLPSETFQIKMVPATDIGTEVDGKKVSDTDANGTKVEVGHELTNDTAQLTFGSNDDTSSGEITKDETIKFEFKTAFTHTGVYRYYVYEAGSVGLTGTLNDKDNGYIKYDKTKYVVDLYVDQNSKGEYVVADLVATIPDDTKKPENISFTNEIDCATLDIKKTVVGTEYQPGEFYTFRILIPVGGDTIELAEGQTISAQICNANGVVIDTENGRTDDKGNVILTVKGKDIDADMKANATEFKLKNGEWLQITGVPVSMIYKVEEDTAAIAGQGYTVTYNYTEAGYNKTDTMGLKKDVDASSVKGTINTNTNEVEFVNTRNMETPNSGISMNVIPYVVILLVAVCGAILLVYNKKRRTH
jgi:hypothetical protein